jgi:hypothetical protein
LPIELKSIPAGATVIEEPSRGWRFEVLCAEPIVALTRRQPSARPLFPKQAAHFQVASLPDDRLCLKRHIRVDVEIEEEHYIAHSVEFREFGYGEDVFGAVEDLQHTICELFWGLTENEDRLGADLKETLLALRDAIEVR